MTGINQTCCCVCLGRCGLPCAYDHRKYLLNLCYIFTFFSTFCSIFAVISIRHDITTTQVGPWSSAHGFIGGAIERYLWAGLSGSVWAVGALDGTTTTNYVVWDSEDCSSTGTYCDNCHSAGNTAIGLVLLAAVTRVPSVMLLRARMENVSDLPIIKSLGIFSEILAAISYAGSLFVWRNYCHLNMPFQHDLEYKYGSGFILVGLGLAITMSLAAAHILIPTYDPDDASHYGTKGCCQGKRKEPRSEAKQRHAVRRGEETASKPKKETKKESRPVGQQQVPMAEAVVVRDADEVELTGVDLGGRDKKHKGHKYKHAENSEKDEHREHRHKHRDSDGEHKEHRKDHHHRSKDEKEKEKKEKKSRSKDKEGRDKKERR